MTGACIGLPGPGDTIAADVDISGPSDTAPNDVDDVQSDSVVPSDADDGADDGADGADGPDSGPVRPTCNAGFGFAASAVQWTLPYPLVGSGQSNNVLSNTNHVLMDLDANGLLDFVVIRDVERQDRDPLVGKNHWLVFRNTGTGFASSPEQWALPYALLGTGFDHNQVANARHVLLDLDGDGRVDFVQFENGEEPTTDPLLGKNHWRLFRNSGSGFERNAMTWRLPYPLLSEQGDFNETGTAGHSLLDLDGNGALDFVVVRDHERSERDPLVGKNHWLVFENTGAGFARTPTTWQLPFALVVQGDETRNAVATNSHSLLDLDGDGRSDFVVHRDDERQSGRDPLVGKNHWLVFANTREGFSLTSTPWGLPFPLIAAGRDESVPSNANHLLLDPSADRKADFVVVRDVERAEADPLTGKHHWPTFVNTGSRFAAASQPWVLPYPLTGVRGDHNYVATLRHALADLDGDGLLDFVEFENGERSEDDVLIGKNHWRVYLGVCQ